MKTPSPKIQLMYKMHYRFQETLDALEDCFDHFEDHLDEWEQRAMISVIATCRDIAENHGDKLDDDQ